MTTASPVPTNAPTTTVLEVTGLNSYYGSSHVLQGIDLEIREGELVALLGRNGAGKTTTLRSIMGIDVSVTGSIRYGGRELTRLATYQIARLGISYIPEERRIFGDGLTVMDNLRLAVLPHRSVDRKAAFEQVFRLFPVLESRLNQDARRLSGGEQQMLAIARALVGSPRLLLIDEPTQGLAPRFVMTIADVLRQIRDRGVSILLVEQNAAVALDLADRVYILDQGLIRFAGPTQAVRDDRELQHQYLGV
jgi:branched-chain amino acid transport system ATP-binding protein